MGFNQDIETEGADREFQLPPGQDELIESHRRRESRIPSSTITSGGSVDVARWIDKVGALLENWYPGQEGGTAMAEVLCGDVNPLRPPAHQLGAQPGRQPVDAVVLSQSRARSRFRTRTASSWAIAATSTIASQAAVPLRLRARVHHVQICQPADSRQQAAPGTMRSALM